MLRSALAILAIFVLAGGSAPAHADEATAWAPAEVSAPAPIWQGLYIGGGGGRRHYETGLTVRPNGRRSNRERFDTFGSVLGGYNWQSGSLVWGIEGDWTRSSHENDSGLYTVCGRAGWAFDNVLIYGTAGVGTEDFALVRTFAGQRIEKQHIGWVAGGGIEALMSQSISARAEVLYFDAGTEQFDFPAKAPSPRYRQH